MPKKDFIENTSRLLEELTNLSCEGMICDECPFNTYKYVPVCFREELRDKKLNFSILKVKEGLK